MPATRTGKGERKTRKSRAPDALSFHLLHRQRDRLERVFACPRPPLNVSLVVDCALATGEGPQAIADRLGLPASAVHHVLLQAVLKLGNALDLDTPAPPEIVP